MTDRKPPFNMSRKKPPDDEEWEHLWPIIEEMHGMLPTVRELDQVFRLTRKKWFWAWLAVGVMLVKGQSIVASIEKVLGIS